MRFTLKIFVVDDVSPTGEYPGWRTLFWLTAERYPRRLANEPHAITSLALRFRGWLPFVVAGRRGDEIVWPKWEPRPLEGEPSA